MDMLKNVKRFLEVNDKLDEASLFKEMDKDGSGEIDLKEFVGFFDKIKRRNNAKGLKASKLDD